MIHALTPDLGDPLLLAEATLPALQEVLKLHRGEAKLTYDPTLKNSVRIRPASGTTMHVEDARNRLSEMIETLSTAAAPLEVSFLKARVRHTSREPHPLDLMRTAAGVRKSTRLHSSHYCANRMPYSAHKQKHRSATLY